MLSLEAHVEKSLSSPVTEGYRRKRVLFVKELLLQFVFFMKRNKIRVWQSIRTLCQHANTSQQTKIPVPRITSMARVMEKYSYGGNISTSKNLMHRNIYIIINIYILYILFLYIYIII